MRTKVLVVALLLIGSALPVATARHLSAGFEGEVGMEPQEDPPTVPQEAYERGIDTTDCYDPEGNLSESDLNRSANADAFCGDLVYHSDTPELRRVSPPDQDFPSNEIGTFDIQVASYSGTLLEDWSLAAAGSQAWNALHTAGSEAGLTDSPEEASSKEPADRDQLYVVNVVYPSASRVVQENTGAWEMNGPYPYVMPLQSFAGFLLDTNGEPISEEDIEGLIDSENLPEDARPRVCGFSPEIDFAATATTGPCEISLHYLESGSQDPNFQDGYRNACESPTYVCSPMDDGAWYGRIQCQFPCDLFAAGDYGVWHWVAAPTLNLDCAPREPGIIFETPEGADMPYLAHDLDVYSPRTTVVEEGRSTPTTIDWGIGVANNAQDQVDQLLDTLPGLPDIPDTSEATATVEKSDRVEPNAKPAGSLEDTSQSLANDPDLQRSLDACSALTSSESPETADPWVDIVDGTAESGTNSQRSGTGQEAQVPAYDGTGISVGNLGLYANTDESQDASNHPGPSTFWTQGQVGMFTDRDDDGTYDTIFFGDKYKKEEIEGEGAYPMLWDVRVNEDGEIDTNAGCTRTGAESIGEMAIDAHYGPHTGLAQLIYLQEPTAFYNPATGQTSPYASGNNIYVLASQAVKHFWTPETSDTVTNPIDDSMDQAIKRLKAYAAQDPAVGEPQVQTPGTELGRTSDFQNQCGEPTGGFTSALSFVHTCQTECSGDTIVTKYMFEVRSTGDGELGGGTIPPLTVDGEDYDFGVGPHAWTDVDPFDNDPDRNRDESSAPPT